MQNNLQCGLDFGTTNSAIAISNLDNKKCIYLFNDKSLLYFPPTNDFLYSVGKKAEENYVNEHMNGRLLKSIKTILRQDNFQFTWIFGKKFTPDELVCLILKYFKKNAETFLKNEINKVVLGRPAIFSNDKKKENIAITRLLNAAKDAGFKDIKLQLEPIAAALAYESTIKEKETVLVADFGGGTSDFTIMKLSTDSYQSDRSSNIIAHGGIYIGGDLFDSEIMWYKVAPSLGKGVLIKSYNKELEIPNDIYWEIRKWERSFLLKDSKMRRALDGYYVFSDRNAKIDNLRVLIDKNLVYLLHKRIEQSKIDLSSFNKTTIDFNESSIIIQEPFSITDFEIEIQDHIIKIENYLISMMSNVNIEPKNIDTVYLTGGSSSVVPIKNIFIKMFGASKIRTGNNFNSIVYGLSIT